MSGSGDKKIEKQGSNLQRFYPSRKTKMKTNIEIAPTMCKNGSRFRIQSDYTEKAVIGSAWRKEGKLLN